MQGSHDQLIIFIAVGSKPGRRRRLGGDINLHDGRLVRFFDEFRQRACLRIVPRVAPNDCMALGLSNFTVTRKPSGESL